ncbi:hypothetical protein ACVW0K_000195 [Streptomyces filamentosus]
MSDGLPGRSPSNRVSPHSPPANQLAIIHVPQPKPNVTTKATAVAVRPATAARRRPLPASHSRRSTPARCQVRQRTAPTIVASTTTNQAGIGGRLSDRASPRHTSRSPPTKTTGPARANTPANKRKKPTPTPDTPTPPNGMTAWDNVWKRWAAPRKSVATIQPKAVANAPQATENIAPPFAMHPPRPATPPVVPATVYRRHQLSACRIPAKYAAAGCRMDAQARTGCALRLTTHSAGIPHSPVPRGCLPVPQTRKALNLDHSLFRE